MKKKISLITILDVPNYGSYLQALATAVTLQDMGTDVEIVHYERPFKNTKLLRRNFFLRGLYFLYFWIIGNKGILFMPRCRKFISKYTKITKPYFSFEELKQNPPKADIYLTGSDQVWNTEHNQGVDEVYYLGFAPKESKKVAFSASIGQDSIPEEFKERTKELLSQYEAISVREDKAVDLLAELGIKATHVLDPTFLLNGEQWLQYASKRLVKDDYLLVYSVEPKEYDCKAAEVAKYIAKEKKLKIVSVSSLGIDKRVPDCDIYFDYALPNDFLSLMAHASFVVASSFHGTAFALNFNKDFITITPGAYSSRIVSMLELTGLCHRRISNISELTTELCKTPIDYEIVNITIDKGRKNSIQFIKESLIKNF